MPTPTPLVLALTALLTLTAAACSGPAERRDAAPGPAAALEVYLAARAAEPIDAARRPALEALAEAVAAAPEPALLFVCTHNSRRSQLAQVWARLAAWHVGLEGLTTYSGGTEVTACNLRTVAALERAGLTVEVGAGPNPTCRVLPGGDAPSVECWSKRLDDPANPTEGFVAVMTCSEADAACPYVPGAATRVALPYEDPKRFDGTPSEDAAYDERSAQIAREMLYVVRRARELRAAL